MYHNSCYMIKGLLFERWANWGTEKVKDLPEVIEFLSAMVQISSSHSKSRSLSNTPQWNTIIWRKESLRLNFYMYNVTKFSTIFFIQIRQAIDWSAFIMLSFEHSSKPGLSMRKSEQGTFFLPVTYLFINTCIAYCPYCLYYIWQHKVCFQ